MSRPILDPLLSLSGVNIHPGVSSALLDDLERTIGISLPIDHREVLINSNGIEVCEGYIRLFGVNSSAGIDSIKWNNPKFWKFSWGNRCLDYWCFAETGWGDQYAYSIPALISGDMGVYFLDCLSMTPSLVASNFSEFLEKEFMRSAKDPYDLMLKEARTVMGALDIDEHLIYMPSPLLGGVEEISSIRKMAARSAMICNGDIARQLDSGPADGSVKSIIPYEDSDGRARLELTWN